MYEWVKFRRIGPEAAYPFPTEHLGRFLGPARNQGNTMSQHVLENGKVIPIQTLRSLTKAELDSPLELSKRDSFDNSIMNLYGDHKAPPSDWIKRRKKQDDGVQYLDNDDEGVDTSFGNANELEQETHSMPEVDSYDDFDAYINAEVLLPQNGDVM